MPNDDFDALMQHLEENPPTEEPQPEEDGEECGPDDCEPPEESKSEDEPSMEDLLATARRACLQWLTDHGIDWENGELNELPAEAGNLKFSMTVFINSDNEDGTMGCRTSVAGIPPKQLRARRWDIMKRMGQSMARDMFPDAIRGFSR